MSKLVNKIDKNYIYKNIKNITKILSPEINIAYNEHLSISYEMMLKHFHHFLNNMDQFKKIKITNLKNVLKMFAVTTTYYAPLIYKNIR